MPMIRKTATTLDAKKRRKCLLTLCIITIILITSIVIAGSQTTQPVGSGRTQSEARGPGSDAIDQVAYINGYHLYDVNSSYIPSTGENYTLHFPENWTVTSLGLDFFNGTLQKSSFVNSSIVTLNPFSGYLSSSLKLNQTITFYPNATIYQAMFKIWGLTLADNGLNITVNGNSNSSYPVIDGNVGIAQGFNLSVYAESLLFKVRLFKFVGTSQNLTAEIRQATYDNNIGGLVKSIEVASTAVSLGSTWVTINATNAHLAAGRYFLVLHTDGWLSSGGGYEAATTVTTHTTIPAIGRVTSNRGVDWQNYTKIGGNSYYFNGFKLIIHISPPAHPIPTNIDLSIDNIGVPDDFIWNQSVWLATPLTSYLFPVTSNFPIIALNFTYTIWYYFYGKDNPFRSGYHITVNGKAVTISSPGDFTLMRVVLGQSDLLAPGVMNTTTGLLSLDLMLFNSTNKPINGSVEITAWAQLVKRIGGLTFGGPGSLVLNLIYGHPNPSVNVTLSEAAVSVSPISSQIDAVYVNNVSTLLNCWSCDLDSGNLTIFREAFAPLPQFTILNDSTLNVTVTVFNDFTATAIPTITGHLSDTTATAMLRVQNTTPLIDLGGLTHVNITISNPFGIIINNSALTLTGPYRFNLTVRGEGIYGIEFITNDSTGRLATRWIGAATVEDVVLASPTVTLNPSSNVTSSQTLSITTNASYVNHPELAFNGSIGVTIYIGTTGTIVQLQTIWNSTTRSYQATYLAPPVNSTTQLTIQVQACDSKHRISTSFTSTNVTPAPPVRPPPNQSSNSIILILAIIAVFVIMPAIAFLIERHRRK